MGILARPVVFSLLALALMSLMACSSPKVRMMETTGYCGCGKCCGWTRGSWKYLKLNFWNRYIKEGPQKGEHYSGKTASGTKPRTPYPGFFSLNTLVHPWKIPWRLLWLKIFPHKGTIAADTRYWPFGTVMEVPGWGTGVVEDRGGAIKGPTRLDLFFDSHGQALEWGRRRVKTKIYLPDD